VCERFVQEDSVSTHLLNDSCTLPCEAKSRALPITGSGSGPGNRRRRTLDTYVITPKIISDVATLNTTDAAKLGSCLTTKRIPVKVRTKRTGGVVDLEFIGIIIAVND